MSKAIPQPGAVQQGLKGQRFGASQVQGRAPVSGIALNRPADYDMTGVNATRGLLDRVSQLAATMYQAEFEKQKAQAEAAGTQKGFAYGRNATLDNIQLPSGNTISEQAYRKAAGSALLLRIDAQASENARRINDEADGDVGTFRAGWKAYMENTLANLPADLQAPAYKSMMAYGEQNAVAVYDRGKEVALDTQKAAADYAFGELETNLLNMAFSNNWEGVDHMLAQWDYATDAAGPEELGGSGAYNQADLVGKFQAVRDKVDEAIVSGYIDRNAQYGPAALKSGKAPERVLEAFKNLPPDVRTRMTDGVAQDMEDRTVSSVAFQMMQDPQALAHLDNPSKRPWGAAFSRQPPEVQQKIVSAYSSMASARRAAQNAADAQLEKDASQGKDTLIVTAMQATDTAALDEAEQLAIQFGDPATVTTIREIKEEFQANGGAQPKRVDNPEVVDFANQQLAAGINIYDMLISNRDNMTSATFASLLRANESGQDEQFSRARELLAQNFRVPLTTGGFARFNNPNQLEPHEQRYIDALNNVLVAVKDDPNTDPFRAAQEMVGVYRQSTDRAQDLESQIARIGMQLRNQNLPAFTNSLDRAEFTRVLNELIEDDAVTAGAAAAYLEDFDSLVIMVEELNQLKRGGAN